MGEESGESFVTTIDRPTITLPPVEPQEYIEPQDYIVVDNETANSPRKLMDSVPEDALPPEIRGALVKYEEKMIEFADKAREKGLPVGIDYFTHYEPGLVDNVLGLGGITALALLTPVVQYALKDVPDSSPLYKGSGGRKSGLWKFTTMYSDPRRTPEQEEEAKIKKLENDPQVIPGILELFRRLSIDELPQLVMIKLNHLRAFGPRQLEEMEARAREFGFDQQYPEAYAVYKEAIDNRIKKGELNGYTASEDGILRGGPQLAQFLSGAIFMANMSKEAEMYHLQGTAKNVISRKGAR